MRNIRLDDLDKLIEKERKWVNERIAINRGSRRRKKSRTRSAGEREALNQISIKRWEEAVEKGHVKYLGDREWYYDYTTVDSITNDQ